MGLLNTYFEWLLSPYTDSDGYSWKTILLIGDDQLIQQAVNTCHQNWFTQTHCLLPPAPPELEGERIPGGYKIGRAMVFDTLDEYIDTLTGPPGPSYDLDPTYSYDWSTFGEYLSAAAVDLPFSQDTGEGPAWRAAGFAVLTYWMDVSLGVGPTPPAARDAQTEIPELEFVKWLAAHTFLAWKSYGMQPGDESVLANFTVEAIPFDADQQPTAMFIISAELSQHLHLPVPASAETMSSIKARYLSPVEDR